MDSSQILTWKKFHIFILETMRNNFCNRPSCLHMFPSFAYVELKKNFIYDVETKIKFVFRFSDAIRKNQSRLFFAGQFDWLSLLHVGNIAHEMCLVFFRGPQPQIEVCHMCCIEISDRAPRNAGESCRRSNICINDQFVCIQ